ncbi:MAG: hypothetical protein OXH71_00025 [Candidatus Dadabacteria bacterium]|nr:hypothetical protein [Candidatus Dadabacteria bacterium]MDE0519087.1 hypothetical protein [Candidatus Dadabacteria bacterium]MDE0663280.1 hypothetical protein [Candidatus Dadabacteria bacterium]
MAISLLLLPTPGAGAGEDFEAGLREGRLHGTEMLSRHSQILRPSDIETEALPGYGTESRQELQTEGTRWSGDPEGMRAEAGTAGGGVERVRSSIEENSAAVREDAGRARERARGGIGSGETKTAEDLGERRDEILSGAESLKRSTKGVRERLDDAKPESASGEGETSRIKKTIESSRAQQRKNDGAG